VLVKIVGVDLPSKFRLDKPDALALIPAPGRYNTRVSPSRSYFSSMVMSPPSLCEVPVAIYSKPAADKARVPPFG